MAPGRPSGALTARSSGPDRPRMSSGLCSAGVVMPAAHVSGPGLHGTERCGDNSPHPCPYPVTYPRERPRLRPAASNYANPDYRRPRLCRAASGCVLPPGCTERGLGPGPAARVARWPPVAGPGAAPHRRHHRSVGRRRGRAGSPARCGLPPRRLEQSGNRARRSDRYPGGEYPRPAPRARGRRGSRQIGPASWLSARARSMAPAHRERSAPTSRPSWRR